MNELYNIWFSKWRKIVIKDMNDESWDVLMSEFTSVCEKYDYKVITEIGIALWAELDRRERYERQQRQAQ